MAEENIQQQKPLYTMFPDMSSLPMLEALYRSFIGPMMGPMLGFNGGMAPAINPGQSAHDAYYATRVNTRQWEAIAAGVNSQFASGIAYDGGKTARNLGVPGLLGKSDADFTKSIDDGLKSGLGKAISGILLQSGMLSPIMGGNVTSAYQHMFSVAPMLASTGGPYQYQDPAAVAKTYAVMNNVTGAITQRIRGLPGGGIGLLPDLGFTRGFKDEDIMRMFSATVAGGAMGGLGGRVSGAMELDAATALNSGVSTDMVEKIRAGTERLRVSDSKLQAVLEEVKTFTGTLVGTFKSLGDIAGTMDPDLLMSAMDNITGGTWRSGGAGAAGKLSALTATLNTTKAFATMTGAAPMDILMTSQALQGRLRANMGITATDMATGFGANITSPTASLDMAMRVHGMMVATGGSTPQDRARIIEEQAFAQHAGMTSTGGKTLSLLALMRQQGAVTDGEFDTLSNQLTAGSLGQRGAAREEIYRRFMGSPEATREFLAKPGNMMLIRSQLTDESMATINQLTYAGQSTDLARADGLSRQRTVGTMLSALDRNSGISSGGLSDADAASMKTRVLSSLQASGVNTSALNSVYETARSKGDSPSRAYAKMVQAAGSLSSMRAFMPNIREAEIEGSNALRMESMARDAFGNTNIAGLAEMGLTGSARSVTAIGAAVTAGLQTASVMQFDIENADEIRKTGRTNPGKAFMQLQSALGSASPAQRAEIMSAMARTARDQGAGLDRALNFGAGASDKFLTTSDILSTGGISVRHVRLLEAMAAIPADRFASIRGAAGTAGEREAAFNAAFGGMSATTMQQLVAYVKGDTALANVLGFANDAITGDKIMDIMSDPAKKEILMSEVGAKVATEEVKQRSDRIKDENAWIQMQDANKRREEELNKFSVDSGSEALSGITAENIASIDDTNLARTRSALGKLGVKGAADMGVEKVREQVTLLAAKYSDRASMPADVETIGTLKELRDAVGFEASEAEKRHAAEAKKEEEKKKRREEGKCEMTGTLTLIDLSGKRYTATLGATATGW